MSVDTPNRNGVRACLENMERLKKKGNAEYVRNEPASVAKAAVLYGELLQEMMKFEKEYPWRSWDTERVLEVLEYEQIQTFDSLKPTVFLNLAAANLKLQGFEGARRCCNAALLFINSPSLLLDDMGAEGLDGSGDITQDVVLVAQGPAVLPPLPYAVWRRRLCTAAPWLPVSCCAPPSTSQAAKCWARGWHRGRQRGLWELDPRIAMWAAA